MRNRRTRRGSAPRDVDRGAAALGPRIIEWFRRARRALPWRGERDAYRVWVSEIMLQQTRVDTVIPYYRRFMERFPAVEALAAAPLEEVLGLWSGLGYYSRARRLHEGARAIVERHGGAFPRDMESALALPGIGAYTAAAVLSIAHGLPLPVIDGNVERVLTRCFRIPGNPKSSRTVGEMRAIALRAIPASDPGDFNQGLMELGALVCKPREPDCPACPLEDMCSARREGDVLRFPEKLRARPTVRIELEGAIVGQAGRYLLELGRDGFLEGLWILPLARSRSPRGHPAESGSLEIRRRLEAELGTTFLPRGPPVTITHSVTYRRIRIAAFPLEPSPPIREDALRRAGGGFRWAQAAEIGRSVPVSSMVTKVIQAFERRGSELEPAGKKSKR